MAAKRGVDLGTACRVHSEWCERCAELARLRLLGRQSETAASQYGERRLRNGEVAWPFTFVGRPDRSVAGTDDKLTK